MGGPMPYRRAVARNYLTGEYTGDPTTGWRPQGPLLSNDSNSDTRQIGQESTRRQVAGDLRRLEQDAVDPEGYIVLHIHSKLSTLSKTEIAEVLQEFFLVH